MRYFIEVAYKGTNYSGFQVQPNAITIQGEIEKAFKTFLKKPVELTGSSRTDAGVHAYQNFFHFDWHQHFDNKWVYNLNAILPEDIVVKNIFPVSHNAHCRFDALSRIYQYRIYNYKNPFLKEIAYYYPYTLDYDKLCGAAAIVKEYTNFTSFSKRNTQVKTFNCSIIQSEWVKEHEQYVYKVTANRFLRGMVRALTATMLKVGRSIITVQDFQNIIESKDCSKAFFDTPAHGLTLVGVMYKF